MAEVRPLDEVQLPELLVGTLVQYPTVGWIELARPERYNAFNEGLWHNFPKAVELLSNHGDVRVVSHWPLHWRHCYSHSQYTVQFAPHKKKHQQIYVFFIHE